MSKDYLDALCLVEAVYKAGGNMEVAKEFVRCRFRLSLKEFHMVARMADLYNELQKI